MPSPAKASFQRKLAAIASGEAARAGAAPAMPTEGPVASEYQQLLAALQIDMNRLRQIESKASKAAAKREMIGKFLPWIEGALASENASQDEIVGNMTVWAIDIADWPLAFRLSLHVLRNELILPERFKRKPATVIAEQVAEAGLEPTSLINLDWLQRFDELLINHDIFDQVRAKLYKAIGFAFHRDAEAFDPAADSSVAGGKSALLKNARDCFQSALTLDKSAGVKKLMDKIDSELKKATAPEAVPETPLEALPETPPEAPPET